jgi:ribosomal 50S subunit-recycling heat shock protein
MKQGMRQEHENSFNNGRKPAPRGPRMNMHLKKDEEPVEAPLFPMRLNQYLAWKRQSSRRDMDKIIEEGRVLVNGSVAVLGTKVNEGDKVDVRFHGNKERAQGNQMAHARLSTGKVLQVNPSSPILNT